MNRKFLFISDIRREGDSLIVELFREDPKFIETLNSKAKVVLKAIKPKVRLDVEKLRDELDPYNDGVVYKIEKKSHGMVLMLGGATDIEIECASINESEVALSPKNLFQALKEWRILYNDAQDGDMADHNKLHEISAYCEKGKAISEKKLSEANWLNEPQKEVLKNRIEVLSQILKLIKSPNGK